MNPSDDYVFEESSVDTHTFPLTEESIDSFNMEYFDTSYEKDKNKKVVSQSDKSNICVIDGGEKRYITTSGKQLPIKKQSALARTRSPSPKCVKRLRRDSYSYSPEPKKIKSVVSQVYKNPRNDKNQDLDKHSSNFDEYNRHEKRHDGRERTNSTDTLTHDTSTRHSSNVSYHEHSINNSPVRSATEITYEKRRSPIRLFRSKSPTERSKYSPERHYRSRRQSTPPLYDRESRSSVSSSPKRTVTSTSARRYSESPQSDHTNRQSFSPQSERCRISSTSHYRSSTPEPSKLDVRYVQYGQKIYERKFQENLLHAYDFLDDMKTTYQLLNTKPLVFQMKNSEISC